MNKFKIPLEKNKKKHYYLFLRVYGKPTHRMGRGETELLQFLRKQS